MFVLLRFLVVCYVKAKTSIKSGG